MKAEEFARHLRRVEWKIDDAVADIASLRSRFEDLGPAKPAKTVKPGKPEAPEPDPEGEADGEDW